MTNGFGRLWNLYLRADRLHVKLNAVLFKCFHPLAIQLRHMHTEKEGLLL